MSDKILTAHGVRKIYRAGIKEVRAVDGVDLEIEKARSVSIVGPSGAGKSTLMHLLGGLDRPTSGKVMLDGVDIYKLGDTERAKIRNTSIGFVFQFYHLLPEFTAVENVLLPALIKGSAAHDKAREILKKVGLRERADHKPGELSGGESQRVAIARALMNDPEILLCDEPTGNLDSKTSESIYELLFDIKANSRTALVIVTHDERMPHRTEKTVHIKDGKAV